ncbi:hypothetical protein PIB30_016493 [Stylosanthes scabra]|uniref:Uncharacterized protein n=1 Tax=Stylosanthes scabra TaxID=79078 RepID=A0ABU6Z6T5_9FABA|nr:hypothetical protein [Stylosanthes scabra]
MPLSPKFVKNLRKQVMELYYSYNQGYTYTPWNPTPYQPHDLGYYEDPSPPYPPSQNGMNELFEALAQERNEIREVQRKIEIQLDLLIKLATLVFEHLNNSSNISQSSNYENFPSQPLSNPWGHIGTLFPCTNQGGRENALLNKEEVESLYECLEEVEENEAQVAEDVDQKVEDNCKEPKGMEIVHSASSEVTPSKLPSEFQFEWVNLPTLNFIGPQHYALLETDDQLGALNAVLDKKETESLELNASKSITCGESEFKSYNEHLHKLHNNRAKSLQISSIGGDSRMSSNISHHDKSFPTKSNLRTINESARWETPHHEKNKKKRKNRALARPLPPRGAAARSGNAIFLATGATAPPRPFYSAPARWPWRARAVSFSTFGRSYQAAWRARALLLVRLHSPHVRAMALVHPRPRPSFSRTKVCN